MGRKSLAEKYYEAFEGEVECDGTWIVLYDFKGIKSSSKFWDNIDRLIDIAGNGSLIQYSAFMTDNQRAESTIVRLARHYGGKAEVFKGEQVNVESLVQMK
jgi:hypothetical protein